MSVGGIVFVVVIVAIWAFLNWRENRRKARGLPRHSGLRLAFAAIGAFAILFSGGCATLFSIDLASRGGRDTYVSFELIAMLSLPVLAAGLLVWWLSMRRGSAASTANDVDDRTK